jgi:type IV pilus assembly protein PilN
MMIRINLLPVRQVQKREAGRQFIVLMAGALILAVIGNGFWWYTLEDKRDKAQRNLDDTNARIAQLEKVIGEVNNLAKRKKEVEEKLTVLDNLRKQRAGPVKVLDALATSIPKKVWIANFAESGGAAALTGSAESYDDVSEFMRSLNSIVWTPKGMARVIDRTKSGGIKVEMLSGDAAIEEFGPNLVGQFFSNIELKGTSAAVGPKGAKIVNFDMTLSVNFAI